MPKFSVYWFTIAFSITYPLFLAMHWEWFLYYPLVGEWSIQPLSGDQGPAMQWYGLIAGAAVCAAALALALKDQWLPRVAVHWIVAFPAASMAACMYVLRGFFWQV